MKQLLARGVEVRTDSAVRKLISDGKRITGVATDVGQISARRAVVLATGGYESNATLVADNVEGVIRDLKARLAGEIDVGGPALAASLTELGLLDEYRLYLHPVVLGSGKPFFAGPRPPLRLVASERIGEDTIRLSYVPA